ncbi:RHS repeat-associated core domain-containing protein [Microtetraspora malaysiensis]|uniref:RHS repeat-associated core domain-containing protein n=1 Tax=Microtetraspora malaysiensis TaxID=161358 RepID=UPI003D906087
MEGGVLHPQRIEDAFAQERLVRWPVTLDTSTPSRSLLTPVFSPIANTQVGTLTPALAAHADPWAGGIASYWFQVCSGTPGSWTWCESSPSWSTSDNWTVPAGKLAWGKTYWWYAMATYSDATVTSSWRTFTVVPEQATINSFLASGMEGREFNHEVGNYTHTETDLDVAAVGLPLSITRTYNSLDPRTDGAFGLGWSTRWDTKLTPEPATSTLLITHPDGQQLRFAAKGDGTYASPSGVYATLSNLAGGGWRFMDKTATSYWFDAAGRLTKVTDHRGRTQDLVYGSNSKLAKVTATGGRSLSFTWTGNHVTSVSTDPVNGAAITSTYAYDGDKLTKACPPASGNACTVYTYGTPSRYQSEATDGSPSGYWRLNDASGAIGSKIMSAIGWDGGISDGKIAGATADITTKVSGALDGSGTTAMRFKGTTNSAYVSLPPASISGKGGSLAVEAWFKTTGSGTVIGYQNSSSTPTSYTPAIYVGTDGKLRGQFWTGTANPITSTTAVNDNNWHHVVLEGAGSTQTLYLDGATVGTQTGAITHVGQWDTRIGYGYGNSSWPATVSSPGPFAFAGDIDEVAIYRYALGLPRIQNHFTAKTAQPQIIKVVSPAGRVIAENTYATDGGRLLTHTDDNGGQWKLSAQQINAIADTQALTTTTVTDPHGATITYTGDALRDYRIVSRTDQLGKATSVEYDTGGFPAKTIDPNGNVTNTIYNARGNLFGRNKCRIGNTCYWEWFSYEEHDDPFDPRNDLLRAFADARSSSFMDDTYSWRSWFSPYGELTTKTYPNVYGDPWTADNWKYTDGTEAAVGGGTVPAGLVKTYLDKKNNATTYRYTASGDLAQATSPTGLITKHQYDAIGRLTATTEVSAANPAGLTTTFTYDAQGRLAAVTSPGVKNEITGVTHTAKKTFTFDVDDNPLTTSLTDLTGGDPERKTTYTYDSYGRADSVMGPEGGVERFGYDHKGQKVSYTDARGSAYSYVYTARGELASATLKGWTGSPVSPQAAVDVVMTSYAYDPAGRLASGTDAMGRTTSFTYYNDDLAAETVAKGVKLNGASAGRDVVLDSKVYDPAGNLTRQTTDGGALRIDAVYDAAARLTSQTVDPAKLARVTSYGYDANDKVIKMTETAAGTDRVEVTEYAYNAAGQPIRQTVRNNGQDLVTTLAVDDRGLVTAITDPRGNVSGAAAADYTTDIRYDVAGSIIEAKLPPVQVERNGGASVLERPTSHLGYNTFGEQTHVVDAEGRRATSMFDRTGRMVSQALPAYTPPGGQQVTPTVTAAYDAAGQQISATDVRGHTTTAVYDGLGRKVRVTDPSVGGAAAGTTTFTYDLLGEALSQTDPTGARWEATYDDLGRQITTSTFERRPAPAVYVTALEYDDADNLVKVTRPTGDSATRVYNALGEMTSYTDAFGNATSFDHDLSGRVVKTTNPLGVSTTAKYDLAGRPIETADVDTGGTVLRTRTFGYDAAGNPTRQTTPSGHTTTRVFDAVNRLIEQREPVSASETITASFGYDAAGQQTRSTDGRGNATYTTYNGLGLVESVIEPSTAAHPNLSDRTWTSVYDAAGNPVTSLDPGGVRVERTFDELNRLIKQTGSGAEAATKDKTYGYDLAGRLVRSGDLTFTLNDRGALLKSTGPGGDISAYAFDGNDRLVQRVDATGTASFTWDGSNRLTRVVDPVTSTTIDYTYDKASRLTQVAYGSNGNRRSFTYDPLSRLTKDELKTGQDGLVASIEYGYDTDNNMISKTTAGTAGVGTNTYTYDWANRLTSWTAPDGKTTEYGWDAAGNRIRAGDKSYTYDERNRLTSGDGYTYTYTPRGTLAEASNGQVQISKFDAFDRLIQDGTVTYDYDAFDRMSTRTERGQTTKFTYDGQTNNLITVTDANNITKASYGRDALGRTISLSDGAGAQLAFSDLHGDLIGTFTASGTALVDSIAYNPFGEVIAQTGAPHELGYQGGYTDPTTKKVNMAARWYQPSTGSFVSRDTFTQSADPIVQLNRYAYANDNPLTNIDPDGHKAKKVTAKLAKMLMTMKTANTTKVSVKTASSVKCPKGLSKGKGPICGDAADEYKDCRKGKTSAKICQGMKDDYVSCRNEGRRDGNFKSHGKVCSDFAKDYVVCRMGSDYYSGNSHSVCTGAGREIRRCEYGAGGRPAYGEKTGSCENVRYDYYSCRADKRGDDHGCSTFAEVSYKCKLHRNVRCDDLEGKFLSCYRGGSTSSPNECAFGVNMLVHCRDSMNRGVFQDKNICGNTWNTFMKECQGSGGLSGETCTKGKSWQDVSYSICEKRGRGGHTCVTYLSPKDRGNLGNGGDLPMVVVNAGLSFCAAVLSVTHPVVAAGCGVVGSVVGLINSIVQNVQQSAINDALSGSMEHGEEGGIQVITWTYDCLIGRYGAVACRPENEHVIHKEYAPL